MAQKNKISGRCYLWFRIFVGLVVSGILITGACKSSNIIENAEAQMDIISITEGYIGQYPVRSGEHNEFNLSAVVGEGYNTQRGAIWILNGNTFTSQEAKIHGGIVSFNHNGQSKYVIIVCPSNLNGLITAMDNNDIIVTHLDKRDHTVGYENDPGATVPSNGQALWKSLLDDVSGSMSIPGVGSFGSLSGFPNGSDFTVGFGTRNYNVGNKVRTGPLGTAMGSELIEHLTNLGNINGDTFTTINTYGFQPILAFAYLVGE